MKKKKLLPLPPEAKDVKIGEVYTHYKGGTYIVKAIGRDSETLEPMVWYMDLDDREKEWGRTLSKWLKPLEDGSPRFLRICDTDSALPGAFLKAQYNIAKAVGGKIKIDSNALHKKPSSERREVAFNPTCLWKSASAKNLARLAKKTEKDMIKAIKKEIKKGATVMTKPMVLAADCYHKTSPRKGFVVYVEIA